MNSQTIENLISTGESQTVEFKQSASSAKDLAREIVAFANTSGGTLILGVDDSGRIIGIDALHKTDQILINALTQSCQPPVQAEIHQATVEGRLLVAVEVPEGRRKPYEANHIPYLRTGSATRPATREEKQELYTSSIKENYELLPVKDATIEDISSETVADYQQRRKARLNTPIEPYSLALLKKLKAVVPINGTLKPTVSGILLFGKEPQQFSETQLGYVRLARFKGTEVGTFIDQLDVYGTLTTQIDDALKFVERNIRFGWTTEKLPREKRYEYPLDVIQEAITNAVAHRDYWLNGTVQVSIFDDRITVQSPGSLLTGVRIDNLTAECKQRNNTICGRLFEMKYIEAYGMGIDMMHREMQASGLPEPTYHDTGASFIVTLIGPGERWMEKETPLPEGLNDRQKKAIPYIRAHGRITNREYRQLTGLGRVHALKELNEMVSQGILFRKGKGRSIYYTLVSD
jgi:ATP-dependent DNA helicase RecG